MHARALKWWIVLVSAGLFGGWELLRQSYMRDLPTAYVHFVSIVVEGAMAVAVAWAAVSSVSFYAWDVDRADRLARIVGRAVGTNALVEAALIDIRKHADVLQHRGLPPDEISRRAAEIAADANRVERTLQTLAALPGLTESARER